MLAVLYVFLGLTLMSWILALWLPRDIFLICMPTYLPIYDSHIMTLVT